MSSAKKWQTGFGSVPNSSIGRERNVDPFGMNDISPILLAEDDDNDALLMERAFVKAGWGIPLHRVGDGDEVIRYLKGQDHYSDSSKYPFPSLLLLDLRMPGKSGFDVLEWIRTQPQLESLLVVVLTSCQVPADVRRAYALGANMFLLKSAKFEGLVEHLRRLQSHWAFHQEASLPDAIS
jgi:CheY-like chemotaxis protein